MRLPFQFRSRIFKKHQETNGVKILIRGLILLLAGIAIGVIGIPVLWDWLF